MVCLLLAGVELKIVVYPTSALIHLLRIPPTALYCWPPPYSKLLQDQFVFASLERSHNITNIPDICHFFTQSKLLENKIYTEKTRKLRQNTQKIANFLRYYGKIHSKLPIFRVKSVKIYTGQKKFTRIYSWGL